MKAETIAKLMIDDENNLLKQDDETIEEYKEAKAFVKEHFVFAHIG